MRRPLLPLALAALMLGVLPLQAQIPMQPTFGAAAPDPVVARVDGQPIYQSEVAAAAAELPPQLRQAPLAALVPLLINQLIDEKALAIAAQKAGLGNEPKIKSEIARARDTVLANAWLRLEIVPAITKPALAAAYKQDYVDKPGALEVHARHILVPTKQEAEKIIAELNKGADFATLAKKLSQDQGSVASGGDLGFFKKSDMITPFADAAFALKPGQYTKTPVHTEFGWHVIEVLAVRRAPPPPFAKVADAIRQKLVLQAGAKAMKKALARVMVQRFNLDGTPIRSPDTAKPPVPAAGQ